MLQIWGTKAFSEQLFQLCFSWRTRHDIVQNNLCPNPALWRDHRWETIKEESAAHFQIAFVKLSPFLIPLSKSKLCLELNSLICIWIQSVFYIRNIGKKHWDSTYKIFKKLLRKFWGPGRKIWETCLLGWQNLII